MNRIQTGATEPIEITKVDALYRPVTGLTNLLLKVRRLSDGYYFDWSDDNFKASPSQLYQALSEVSAALSPGEYRLNSGAHAGGFNTSAIVNPTDDDIYKFTTLHGTGIVADPIQSVGEVKVGDWVDFIDEAISDQASPSDITTILESLGLDHLITVDTGGTPAAPGTYIREIIDLLNSISTGGSVYSVLQSYAYNPATDLFVGQIWIETNNLVFATPTSVSVTIYDSSGTSMFTETDATPDAQGIFKITKTAPGFTVNSSYYALSTVAISGFGSISSAKGAFTL